MLKPWSLFCLLVLLTGAISGCVQDEMDPPAHPTAKTTAQHAAESHRDRTGQDLQILGIFAASLSGADDPRWTPLGADPQQEATPGETAEGRFPRWGIIHKTPGADTPYTMSPYGLPGKQHGPHIGFDQETHPELMEVFGNVELDPDGDWIDSDKALENAAGSNQQVHTLLANGEADLVMFLQHVTGRPQPHWFIQVTPHSAEPPITTLVDADTGGTLRAADVYVQRPPERSQTNVTARRGTEWSLEAETLDRPSLSVRLLPRNNTALHDLYEVDAHIRLPNETPVGLQGQWPQVMNLTLLRSHTGTYTLSLNASLLEGADDALPDAAWPEVQLLACFDGIRPDPLGLVPRGGCMGESRSPGPR